MKEVRYKQTNRKVGKVLKECQLKKRKSRANASWNYACTVRVTPPKRAMLKIEATESWLDLGGACRVYFKRRTKDTAETHKYERRRRRPNSYSGCNVVMHARIFDNNVHISRMLLDKTHLAASLFYCICYPVVLR